MNRFDDKPKVNELAIQVGTAFVSKADIQAFPLFLEQIKTGLTIESKWKMKHGCLTLLKIYAQHSWII